MNDELESSRYSIGSAGSTVRSLYVEREVKVFAVLETEFNSLSSLSAFATIMYTLAGSFVAFAVGIYTNAVFYEKLTPAGMLAIQIAAPGLLIVGASFFVVAAVASFKRSGLWKRIRNESKSRAA